MSEGILEAAMRLATGMGGAATTALRVVVIDVAAWILIVVLQRAIRAFRIRIASRFDDREAIKRAETLGRVYRDKQGNAPEMPLRLVRAKPAS